MSLLHNVKNNLAKHPTRFMLFTFFLMIVSRMVAYHFEWGWHFAAALSFGLTAVFIAYAFIMHEDYLKKIILFSLVTGITELAADWWLVDITQTLVYNPDEPFIWRSPIYMPFAWCMILTNIGYLAHSIMHKNPRWLAIVFAFIIGGTIIPVFEHFAKGAGWWYYKDCRMIWEVPYYIILGEGLICCMLGFLLHYLNHHKYRTAVMLGVVHGLWIWFAYYISYTLLK